MASPQKQPDPSDKQQPVPWSTAIIRAVPGLERALSTFRKETQPMPAKPLRSSFFVAFDKERKQGRFASNFTRNLTPNEIKTDEREFQTCERLKTQAIQKGLFVLSFSHSTYRSR
jgi:hypothetical protein